MVLGCWVSNLGYVVHSCHYLPFTHPYISLPIINVVQLPRQKTSSTKKDVKVLNAIIVRNLRSLRQHNPVHIRRHRIFTRHAKLINVNWNWISSSISLLQIRFHKIQ